MTVDDVKKAFNGKEPDCGGYDSKFKYKKVAEGVVVTLVAEWGSRRLRPSVLVTAVEDENVCFRFMRNGSPDGDIVQELVDDLIDQLVEQAEGA